MRQSFLERWIAKTVAFRVEHARGSTCASSVASESKPVVTKLEMVRATGLFHCSGAVPRVRWINSGNRLQRDEIHRCLQGSVGASKGGPRCNRGARFTDKRRIPCLRKLTRQRRIR